MARKYDIGFVGGGNMAEALVRGLVEAGNNPAGILVADPEARRRSRLKRRYGVFCCGDNLEVARGAGTVVLAVKPQIMDTVLAEIGPELSSRQLVISIAAGVRLARLEKGLGEGIRVVRVMPNTPCLVGKGAIVMVGGSAAGPRDLRKARGIFATVGAVYVSDDEKVLDPVTGLSGSGPAYVYRFAEALIEGGKAAGLDPELARRLAYQTLAGAAEMLLQTGESPEDLRRAVSSPGGTTVAGLERLEKGRLVAVVKDAVRAATRRSRELGKG